MGWQAGVDVNTGDLITAAWLNARIGTTGSLNSIRPAYESAVGGLVSVNDETDTSLASVTFDVEDGDMVMFLGAITAMTLHVDVGDIYFVYAKIARTAGAGGTVVAPVIQDTAPPYPAPPPYPPAGYGSGGLPLTPWGTFAAVGAGAHTFAIQIAIETDVAVGPHQAAGSILAIKFGVPLTPF